MDARSYPQLCVGFVRDLEVVTDVDQVESHAGDLPSVIDAIFFGDPRDHHVWNVNYSKIDEVVKGCVIFTFLPFDTGCNGGFWCFASK